MFAVIQTGGKQYVVSPGKKIRVGKLTLEVGSSVVFDEVLLAGEDGGVKVGMPFVKGAQVQGKVTAQGRAKKVISYKYEAKKREHKKRGHRQHFTEVEIAEITGV